MRIRWHRGLGSSCTPAADRDLARVEPRRLVGRLLLGLLSDLPGKNCWKIAEWAEDTTAWHQHLQCRAAWDAEAIRADVREYVVENPLVHLLPGRPACPAELVALSITSWIRPLPFAHLSVGGWSTQPADAASRAERQLPDLARVWPENPDQPRNPRVTAWDKSPFFDSARKIAPEHEETPSIPRFRS